MRPKATIRIVMAGVSFAGLAFMSGSAQAADDEPCDGIGSLAGTNSAPLAVDDEAWVEPGGSIAIDVLANDIDFDGDELKISSVTVATHGEATIEDGQVIYEPGLGFEGDDAFSYHVDDGACGTDQARVTVLVSQDPPPEDEAKPDDDPVVEQPTFTG